MWAGSLLLCRSSMQTGQLARELFITRYSSVLEQYRPVGDAAVRGGDWEADPAGVAVLVLLPPPHPPQQGTV